MDPARWAQLYDAIVADLGLDAKADADAARLFARRLGRPSTLAPLARRVAGRDVHVLGAGPQLARLDLRALPRPLVAADGACGALAATGVIPDAVVTDLDGDAPAQAAMAARGAALYVAAHGDNVPALERWAPRLPTAQGTTQVPGDGTGLLHVPGFTDGDRACFLAAAAGARSVTLHAFDFETPGASSRDASRKRAKLAWAERLLSEPAVPVRRAPP